MRTLGAADVEPVGVAVGRADQQDDVVPLAQFEAVHLAVRDRMNETLKRYPLPSVKFVRSWQTVENEPVR